VEGAAAAAAAAVRRAERRGALVSPCMTSGVAGGLLRVWAGGCAMGCVVGCVARL